MLLTGAGVAAVGPTLVTASATRRFPAAVTGLALAGVRGEWLAVVTDDKRLSVLATPGLAILDSVELPRRGSALAVAALPGGAGGSAVIVGDKIGDVHAFGVLPRVSGKSRMLLAHTGSIITALTVAGGGTLPPLLLSADRDEKVRVSSWTNPHAIAAFCLGHLRYVSAIATISVRVCVRSSNNGGGGGGGGGSGVVRAPFTAYDPGELLVSSSGDGTLRLWHSRTGTLLHSIYFKPPHSVLMSEGGALAVCEVCAPGVSHVDPDMTFSTSEAGGGGAGDGEGAGAMQVEEGEEGEGEVAQGGAGAGAEVDADAAAPTTTGEVAIPATAVNFRPAPLPPAITPAALVTFPLCAPPPSAQGPDAPRHLVVIATFLVSEPCIRLFALDDGTSHTNDVDGGGGGACGRVSVHSSQSSAALASGAGIAVTSDDDDSGAGTTPAVPAPVSIFLPQPRMLPLGHLRLLHGALPLSLSLLEEDHISTPPTRILLVGALCNNNTGGGGATLVHRVLAFAVEAGGVSGGGGGVEPVGADAEWHASDDAVPMRLRAVSSVDATSAVPWLTALNAALVADAPVSAGATPAAIALLASPMTARPAEYDKAWVAPDKRRRVEQPAPVEGAGTLVTRESA